MSVPPGEALPLGSGSPQGLRHDHHIPSHWRSTAAALCLAPVFLILRSAAAAPCRAAVSLIDIGLPPLPCRASEVLSLLVCRRHWAAPPKYYRCRSATAAVPCRRVLLYPACRRCGAAPPSTLVTGLPPLLCRAASYLHGIAAALSPLFDLPPRSAHWLLFWCCRCCHHCVIIVIPAAWPRSSAGIPRLLPSAYAYIQVSGKHSSSPISPSDTFDWTVNLSDKFLFQLWNCSQICLWSGIHTFILDQCLSEALSVHVVLI